MQKKCSLSVAAYVKKVVMPLIGTALFMLMSGLASNFFWEEGAMKFVITCMFTTIGMIVSLILFALGNEEKKQIYEVIANLIIVKKKRKKLIVK